MQLSLQPTAPPPQLMGQEGLAPTHNPMLNDSVPKRFQSPPRPSGMTGIGAVSQSVISGMVPKLPQAQATERVLKPFGIEMLPVKSA